MPSVPPATRIFPSLSVACAPSSRAALMFPVSVQAPWTWARSSCVFEISSIAPAATPTRIAKRGLFMNAPLEDLNPYAGVSGVAFSTPST